MATIRSIDMLFIDDLFDMQGGYVLKFSDRTFGEFFRDELKLNINDPAFARTGPSKAKRLRCFLQTVDNPTAVRTLQALWEYREALRLRDRRPEAIEDAKARISDLIHRLGGPKPETGRSSDTATSIVIDAARIDRLAESLIALSQLDPQARGYAFEAFLKELFDAYGLQGRASFRIRGEQIDGSFVLNHETYLLEAKWQNTKTGVTELHAFNGKVASKTSWARGLFISQIGFSDDGLSAFAGGKNVICMDGLDLYETLSRKLALSDVLAGKVRRAVETGQLFVRVRDLFPV